MSSQQAPISPSDHAILVSLHQYYFLTAEQLLRLHYKAGALTHLQTKLKKLTDSGYVLRTMILTAPALGKTSARGKLAFVYCLSRKAQHYLEELGVDIDRRFEPQEEIRRSNAHLLHTLSVNDFLISAALLAKSVGWIELAEMIHERSLKRQVDRVSIPKGDKETESVAVIPDGWLDFRVQKEDGLFQVGVALELDRGTEEQKAWRRKVRALIAWHKGPFEQHFQIMNTQGQMVPSSLYIAVVAIPGPKRTQELLSWTQAELLTLAEQNRTEAAQLFHFSHEDPQTTDPQRLFLEPIWQQPLHPAPLSLLIE